MIEIVIPGTPDKRANPNARCSERTRRHYRKAFAADAVMPLRDLRIQSASHGPLFVDDCTVDVLIRWERGRNTYGDRDNIVAMLKPTFDQLQRERIIENDRYLHIGRIEQERATGQPETVLTIRQAAAEEQAA